MPNIKKEALDHTPVISVKLLPATTSVSAVLVRGPVGHAAELVALGIRGVGNTVQGSLGGDGRAPGVAQVGERIDQIEERGFSRHDVYRSGGGCAILNFCFIDSLRNIFPVR